MSSQGGNVGRISGDIQNKQCYKCGQYCPPSQVIEIARSGESVPQKHICRNCLAKLSGQDLWTIRKGRS